MLDTFIPHAEYAEDQLYDKGVLYAHVGYRGLQSGAVLGAVLGAIRTVRQRKSLPTSLVRAAWLRSIGVGGVIGIGVSMALVPLRMMGREKIEWQDRTWRLLANKSQEEVDDWTLPGSVLGAAAVAVRGARPIGWQSVMGGAGVGSLTALGTLMLWRLIVRKESKENVKPSGPMEVQSSQS
ncbi:hypothetical protein MMC10_003393 [Thelotrema lepadinum]|nr:hypothetical protein [Thelotrema lepadinum]